MSTNNRGNEQRRVVALRSVDLELSAGIDSRCNILTSAFNVLILQLFASCSRLKCSATASTWRFLYTQHVSIMMLLAAAAADDDDWKTKRERFSHEWTVNTETLQSHVAPHLARKRRTQRLVHLRARLTSYDDKVDRTSEIMAAGQPGHWDR